MDRSASSRAVSKPPVNNMKRRKRLGGKALSLDAFVKAKSKPGVNPSEMRKHRELYENAKKVKKYRKLVKQLGGQEQRLQPIQDSEQDQSTSRERLELSAEGIVGNNISSHRESNHLVGRLEPQRKHKMNKGRNPLEILREDFVKKKQEEEKLKQEKEESLKAKLQVREEALQMRKDLKIKMWKRTRTGQPVMKHRLEHILGCLERQN